MATATPRESKRITYSSEIRALKLVPFNPEQMSIIKGALLGDGCLHAGWPGTSVNYVFSKTHSLKQREYVEWTCKKLQPFVIKEPYLYAPVQSLKMRTISHSALTALRKIFYPSGKKSLPKDIQSIISDPLAVAVRFMDDGNAFNSENATHGYHLNTQSFSKEDNERIKSVFKRIYDIDCSVQKNNGKYRIFVRVASMEKFAGMIYPHIIPSMMYKLGSIGDSLRTRRDWIPAQAG